MQNYVVMHIINQSKVQTQTTKNANSQYTLENTGTIHLPVAHVKK